MNINSNKIFGPEDTSDVRAMAQKDMRVIVGETYETLLVRIFKYYRCRQDAILSNWRLNGVEEYKYLDTKGESWSWIYLVPEELEVTPSGFFDEARVYSGNECLCLERGDRGILGNTLSELREKLMKLESPEDSPLLTSIDYESKYPWVAGKERSIFFYLIERKVDREFKAQKEVKNEQ